MAYVPLAIAYDAVTLRHFAVAGRLDVCEKYADSCNGPRWTDKVFREIQQAYNGGAAYCRAVLDATWLGEPFDPGLPGLKPVYQLQVGLNGGLPMPTQHGGEAESIYYAENVNGFFATDDFAAHDFACRRPALYGRVIDTIDILRAEVASGYVTAVEAADLVTAIYDADRYLRRCHPDLPSASYFL